MLRDSRSEAGPLREQEPDFTTTTQNDTATTADQRQIRLQNDAQQPHRLRRLPCQGLSDDIMHPQHQVLRIFRSLVPISQLQLWCTWNLLGTTESAAKTGEWGGEAGWRCSCLGSFRRGWNDLGREAGDLDALRFVVVGGGNDLWRVRLHDV